MSELEIELSTPDFTSKALANYKIQRDYKPKTSEINDYWDNEPQFEEEIQNPCLDCMNPCTNGGRYCPSNKYPRYGGEF